MTIRQDQIRITVVVVIEKAQAPTTEQTRRRSDFARSINKGQVFLVLIKTEQLLVDVGHEQVLPAVAVIVCRIDTHPGSRRARIAVSDTRQQPDLLKFSFPLIYEKKVLERVVRDEEIHQAVVVYVSSNRSKRFAKPGGDARILTDVEKLSSSLIVEEKARSRFEHTRHAVIAATDAVIATEDRSGSAVLHKAGDKEIEFAVVVVIEKRRTGRPIGRSDSGLVRNVCKGAVAVVVEKHVGAVVGYVQVLPTIAIVIRRRRAHTESAHLPAGDTSLVGDVDES